MHNTRRTIKELRSAYADFNPFVKIFHYITGNTYYLGRLNEAPTTLDTLLVNHTEELDGVFYVSAALQ